MAFKVIVEGFADGAAIPRKFACDGADTAPALEWHGEPSGTKSFALIMEDPDAPAGTWNHWLVWDIPAQIHAIPAGGAAPGKSGRNDFGKRGYGGPCPPRRGGPHRYFFRLFAVDTPALGLKDGAGRDMLEKALHNHVLASTEYMGRYERL